MAIPHDGSVYGATSTDDAHVPPLPAETERRRLRVFGRTAALAVDETLPATHRSRRHRTAHGTSPQAPDEQVSFFAGMALPAVSLVLICVVAVGSTFVSAAILHFVSPDRRFDAFRALHEPWVLGVLFGLGVLWLLPPYPWAVAPAEVEPKRHVPRAKAAA